MPQDSIIRQYTFMHGKHSWAISARRPLIASLVWAHMQCCTDMGQAFHDVCPTTYTGIYATRPMRSWRVQASASASVSAAVQAATDRISLSFFIQASAFASISASSAASAAVSVVAAVVSGIAPVATSQPSHAASTYQALRDMPSCATIQPAQRELHRSMICLSLFHAAMTYCRSKWTCHAGPQWACHAGNPELISSATASARSFASAAARAASNAQVRPHLHLQHDNAQGKIIGSFV